MAVANFIANHRKRSIPARDWVFV